MILTTDQLNHVLASGGCLVLDGTTMTLNQLRDLAAHAKTGNAKLTIKRVGNFTADQLQRVAALAPGLVTFDLT